MTLPDADRIDLEGVSITFVQILSSGLCLVNSGQTGTAG